VVIQAAGISVWLIRIEVLKRDFPSRGAQLVIDPPDWNRWWEVMEQIKYQFNVNKVVKEAIEKIVARGTIEEEWEQILISTAARLRELLFSRAMDGEWGKRAQALQSKMGFFLPPLTETMFAWMKEDNTKVIDGIIALGGDSDQGEEPSTSA